MNPPIRYYGGKVFQAEWICDVLRQYKFHTYIEPFGGSGAVLFAKPPSHVEVYNDIHSDLVNLYMVLRDPQTFEEFVNFVENSPYAREILQVSRVALRNNKPMTNVERAGHFFITLRQNFTGTQRGWSSIGKIGRQQAHPYRHAIDRLPEVHARLRNVHIENIDAIECIQRYASNIRTTMTYCDPPYVTDTRIETDVYVNEMTDDQHVKLVETLLEVPGHKLLSGYKSPIYQPLLDAGWTCLEKDFVCRSSSYKTTRTECLYCSPSDKPRAKMNLSVSDKTIR